MDVNVELLQQLPSEEAVGLDPSAASCNYPTITCITYPSCIWTSCQITIVLRE